MLLAKFPLSRHHSHEEWRSDYVLSMVNFKSRSLLILTHSRKGHDQLLFRKKILLFSQRTAWSKAALDVPVINVHMTRLFGVQRLEGLSWQPVHDAHKFDV